MGSKLVEPPYHLRPKTLRELSSAQVHQSGHDVVGVLVGDQTLQLRLDKSLHLLEPLLTHAGQQHLQRPAALAIPHKRQEIRYQSAEKHFCRELIQGQFLEKHPVVRRVVDVGRQQLQVLEQPTLVRGSQQVDTRLHQLTVYGSALKQPDAELSLPEAVELSRELLGLSAARLPGRVVVFNRLSALEAILIFVKNVYDRLLQFLRQPGFPARFKVLVRFARLYHLILSSLYRCITQYFMGQNNQGNSLPPPPIKPRRSQTRVQQAQSQPKSVLKPYQPPPECLRTIKKVKAKGLQDIVILPALQAVNKKKALSQFNSWLQRTELSQSRRQCATAGLTDLAKVKRRIRQQMRSERRKGRAIEATNFY